MSYKKFFWQWHDDDDHDDDDVDDDDDDDDIPNMTPFCLAVRQHHDECLRVFLSHDRSLAKYRRRSDGNTPLHVATVGTNVKTLLKYGADINAVNNKGVTPLYVRALHRGSVMRSLLKVVDLEEDPDKLIFHVVKSGKAKVLSCVLASKFGSNASRSRLVDGSSAMHMAVQRQNVKFLKLLLKFGFDPNIRLESGLTPAHLLATKPLIRGGKASRFEHLKLLSDAGADFEMKCTFDKHQSSGEVTLVEYAILEQNYHVAAFLAEVAGVSLDGVKRLVDVASVDEYIQAMCVCKRAVYCLYPCPQCDGETHARTVKIMPKPLQLINMIQATAAASDDVTSGKNDDTVGTSRLRQNDDVVRGGYVNRAIRKLLRRNVDKSQAAADAYIVKGTWSPALPYDATDPHAEEFDVENFRCKCGKFRYNLEETCTKNRCEYATGDSKI